MKNDKPVETDEKDEFDLAKKRLEAAHTFDADNREEALKDLKFLALDQWPEDVRSTREKQGRPCLTLDRLNQHKNQVVNDIRKAKIAIKAVGVDGNTDPNLAEIYTALMRDIQHRSSAPHVYAGAADGSVSCGIGHFRIETQYEDESVFNQEICINPIPYPLAVYWDPAATKPDRSDAMWCFVTEFIPSDTFKEDYPDAQPLDVNVPSDGMSPGIYWVTKDGVLIAEYWCKKKVKRRIVAFEDGSTRDVTDLSEFEMAQLPPVVGEREVDGYKVEQRLMNGQEWLSERNEWAGKYIPIIPIIGTEVHLDRKTVRMGLIRGARDAQQLYNYWRSAAAELIALAPKAKWLATAKQIASRITEWAKAHLSPEPYLLYEVDDKVPGGKPELVPPPQPPAAIWQEATLVIDDMKAATGQYDAALGAKSNETSGVAIARRQQEGDIANYHFSDNFEHGLEHTGRVLIDLIPKIYDTQRTIRIMGEDDEQDFIPINTPVLMDNGEQMLLNDLSQGRFDIRVTIGPSYTSQRIEAAESMVEYAKADPDALPFIRDKVVKALDWPDADEISERLKRTIPPEVLGKDERPQEMQQQGPSQEEQQAMDLQMKAEGAKVAETEGKARKAHAEADQTEIENAQMQGAAQAEQAVAQQIGVIPQV